MFFAQVKQALLESNPQTKVAQVQQIHATLNTATFTPVENIEPIEIPGRPEKPELVRPSQVARRKITTEEGRIALIHSICHIEFNAINLALDAAYRFQNLPEEFYLDWIRVALEESQHFSLLAQRLQELDCNYGDLPAHNGLWEMALKTQHSVIERMALVPRVLEARGLDVTPGMIERLQSVGDNKTVEILNIILREEIGHVEIGTRWFRYCCKQVNVDAEQTFINLLRHYKVTTGKGPMHITARERAGFHPAELAALREPT